MIKYVFYLQYSKLDDYNQSIMLTTYAWIVTIFSHYFSSRRVWMEYQNCLAIKNKSINLKTLYILM